MNVLQPGSECAPAIVSYAAELVGRMAAASEDDADTLIREGVLSALVGWLSCPDTPILIQVGTACSRSSPAVCLLQDGRYHRLRSAGVHSYEDALQPIRPRQKGGAAGGRDPSAGHAHAAPLCDRRHAGEAPLRQWLPLQAPPQSRLQHS
jgi:hypothetical protein